MRMHRENPSVEVMKRWCESNDGEVTLAGSTFSCSFDSSHLTYYGHNGGEMTKERELVGGGDVTEIGDGYIEFENPQDGVHRVDLD